jgi:flagella basal body P-ring formation protein FlgA
MVRRLIFCFSALLGAGLAAPVSAVERQKIPPILKIVENFVRGETAALHGRVSFNLGSVDPHLTLPACRALEPFIPAGARLWGQAMVGVRCNEQAGWTMYVPVSIRVMANVVHAVRPLAHGQQVEAADITLQEADLAQLPGGILTDMNQALGKTLVSNIAAGQPLRQDILRAPLVIQQGQTVQLQTQGRGFSARAEGKALSAAADGQVVQVRITSGRTISGIARPGGIVEVRP